MRIIVFWRPYEGSPFLDTRKLWYKVPKAMMATYITWGPSVFGYVGPFGMGSTWYLPMP